MKRLLAVALGGIAGVIAFRCLPRELRGRVRSKIKDRVGSRVDRFFAGLPEDFPPKLIVTVLPKLSAQNEQIIAMLREQNEMMKEHQGSHMATTAV